MLADCYCKKYKTSFSRNNKKRKTADQTEQTEQPIVSLADMLVMRIDHKLLLDMLRYDMLKLVYTFKNINKSVSIIDIICLTVTCCPYPKFCQKIVVVCVY